ncbi:aminotransferase class IV [bacterium]|nr:aminotransferase class IV [bacterium]
MTEKGKVWVNGTLIPWEQATVPLLSHGFSRGSAIFEVFGVHQGATGIFAFRMDEHLKRLENSARLLEMELAYSTAEMMAAVKETARANHIGRGLIKMMAYWSEEAVIHLVLNSKLDLAIFAIPESENLKLDQMDKPISACFSKWRKIHPETVPVGAKACSNYLNSYLTRKDANNRGFDIGIMKGTDGFLAEGSTESVFIVKDGILKTPPLGRVLNSISRKSILEAAPVLGIPCLETIIAPEELLTADEMFTAHTGVKIHSINRFEDRTLQAPGPVSKKLIAFVEQLVRVNDDRFKHWFQPL